MILYFNSIPWSLTKLLKTLSILTFSPRTPSADAIFICAARLYFGCDEHIIKILSLAQFMDLLGFFFAFYYQLVTPKKCPGPRFVSGKKYIYFRN